MDLLRLSCSYIPLLTLFSVFFYSFLSLLISCNLSSFIFKKWSVFPGSEWEIFSLYQENWQSSRRLRKILKSRFINTFFLPLKICIITCTAHFLWHKERWIISTQIEPRQNHNFQDRERGINLDAINKKFFFSPTCQKRCRISMNQDDWANASTVNIVDS